MKAGEAVSLQRMKAWWAYTEIRSPRLREEYRIDPRVPPLCAKIETVAFECLSAFEVNALAEIFETFRGSYLNHYWVDVQEFVIEEWSAEQLGRVFAMSEVGPSGEGRYQPFAVYAAAPRPTGPTAWLDPRLAADKVPLTAPIGHPILLSLGATRGSRFSSTAISAVSSSCGPHHPPSALPSWCLSHSPGKSFRQRIAATENIRCNATVWGNSESSRLRLCHRYAAGAP